jgi:hypothetical protein
MTGGGINITTDRRSASMTDSVFNARKATVDYRAIDDNSLLNVMVEGRNISTRREALHEYKRRLLIKDNLITTLNERLSYYLNLEDKSISINRTTDKSRVFIVPISKTECAIYDEQKHQLHICSINHNSEFRGALEMLMHAVDKCGINNHMYIESDYITRVIRTNINKWRSNRYTGIDGKQIKNEDLLSKLVATGFDFTNIMVPSDAHKSVMKHVKEMYSRYEIQVLFIERLYSVDIQSNDHQLQQSSEYQNTTVSSIVENMSSYQMEQHYDDHQIQQSYDVQQMQPITQEQEQQFYDVYQMQHIQSIPQQQVSYMQSMEQCNGYQTQYSYDVHQIQQQHNVHQMQQHDEHQTQQIDCITNNRHRKNIIDMQMMNSNITCNKY